VPSPSRAVNRSRARVARLARPHHARAFTGAPGEGGALGGRRCCGHTRVARALEVLAWGGVAGKVGSAGRSSEGGQHSRKAATELQEVGGAAATLEDVCVLQADGCAHVRWMRD
jgi:hypothetical protein